MWNKKYNGSFDSESNPPVVEQIHNQLVDHYDCAENKVEVVGWIPPAEDSESPYIEVKCDLEIPDHEVVDSIVEPYLEEI